MDFREFRSGKVWVKVVYGPAPNPNDDPRFQPRQFVGRIAYAPGMLSDEDVAFLAEFEHVRLLETTDALERPSPTENRSSRRARERAAQRADATPPGKDERPTLIDYLKRLVVDWDLTDGPDDPLPIAEETFRQMEFGLRMEIVTTIMADYLTRPNQMTSSSRSSGETTASGPTGPTSASEPSTTGEASSPGTSGASPT